MPCCSDPLDPTTEAPLNPDIAPATGLPGPATEWWEGLEPPVAPSGYAEMIEQLRRLQDAVAEAAPDTSVVQEVTQGLRRLATVLQPAAVGERSRVFGRAEELPGRGQALIPVLRVEHEDATELRGQVRYTSFHLGGNGAVHGGAIPLLFDDVLGRFANSGGRRISRTAYLHVDFRSVTPVEQDLTLSVRFARKEGRKRFVHGTLSIGERICAEAEGLFVELRPGQS